jgi:hypothetical protein
MKDTIYVSHGAGSVHYGVDWFVVEPGPDGDLMGEVKRLRKAGRKVKRVRVKPWTRKSRYTKENRAQWVLQRLRGKRPRHVQPRDHVLEER